MTGDRNQAKITIIGVPDRPGIAARVFGAVANANIVVDMIIQNVSQASMTDISFTVPSRICARPWISFSSYRRRSALGRLW